MTRALRLPEDDKGVPEISRGAFCTPLNTLTNPPLLRMNSSIPVGSVLLAQEPGSFGNRLLLFLGVGSSVTAW